MISFAPKRAAVLVAFGVVMLILVIILIGRLISWGACELYGLQTEREVRYATFVGCMVKTKDGWFPKNELRVIQ